MILDFLMMPAAVLIGWTLGRYTLVRTVTRAVIIERVRAQLGRGFIAPRRSPVDPRRVKKRGSR